MKIPKKLKRNNRTYIFEKIYPNFVMYRDEKVGLKLCISRFELGLIKEKIKPSKILNKIPKK